MEVTRAVSSAMKAAPHTCMNLVSEQLTNELMTVNVVMAAPE